MNKEKEVSIKIRILILVAIMSLVSFGFYYYEIKFIKTPLENFCNNINNSQLMEYKDQWCSSGSDYLVKCSNGNIYGVDTINYCEKWNTWGDCIKYGKFKFKLSHLTYPKC